MITNFFKPQAPSNTIPSSPLPSSHLSSSSSPVNLFNASDNDKVLADLDLKSDPAERKQMSKFSPNIRDRVRRYYILKKPCQPEEFEFPSRDIGGELRRFNPDWFDDPYSQWLEYSVKKDAAFCLCCYLFKNELGGYGRKVSDAFTTKGFRNWNKGIERLKKHVGEVNSVHTRCFMMMLDLMNQEQSILTSFDKPFEKFKGDYRVRLNASVDVIRYLLKEGMPFRGHNECVTSTRRGHFLDLLKWYADKKEDVKNVVLEDVSLFCEKNGIMIPEMNEKYGLGKSKRKSSSVIYSHHLRVEVFYAVIDLQLSELNNRFSEVNTDLLLGMASLSPENSFANYDKNRIMKLATYYPNEFGASKLDDLSFDLDNYIYY